MTDEASILAAVPSQTPRDGPVVRWSAAVAVGGLLFGFDTAVISAADQPLQQLWSTSDLVHGALVMSSALWGTVLGALAGHLPCDRWGRRPTLLALALLYLVSAVGSALAGGPFVFGLMRFVGGLGVGLSSVAVPAHIAELAPARLRGRLVALYQFQIVLGILVAYLSNTLLAAAGLDWRWMLGAEALPAVGFLWLLRCVPESPRWLLLYAGDEVGARAVLRQSDPTRVEETLAAIRSSRPAAAAPGLFSPAYRRPAALAVLVAAFNQLSGINAVIYFAPRIFSLAGLDTSAALLSTTGIGLVNLVSTLVGLALIDHVGRRRLLLVGSLGYIVSLGAVAAAFAAEATGLVVVGFLLVFIASHAVGQGAVIWVFLAEIFPNAVRGKGQSLGSGTHWVGAALVTMAMPAVFARLTPETVFLGFGALMVGQLVFVLTVMPETRGRSLEALAADRRAAEPTTP